MLTWISDKMAQLTDKDPLYRVLHIVVDPLYLAQPGGEGFPRRAGQSKIGNDELIAPD